MLSYNRANRAVAILCNHQRAAPKNFSKQMENIMAKVILFFVNHTMLANANFTFRHDKIICLDVATSQPLYN